MPDGYFNITDEKKLNSYLKSDDIEVTQKLIRCIYETYYDSWIKIAFSIIYKEFPKAYEIENLPHDSFMIGMEKFYTDMRNDGFEKKGGPESVRKALFAYWDNTLKDMLQKFRRRKQREKLSEHLPELKFIKDDFEWKDLFVKAIVQLNETDRKLILLLQDGCKNKEIRILFGWADGTVRNNVSAAKQSLRSALQNLYEKNKKRR